VFGIKKNVTEFTDIQELIDSHISSMKHMSPGNEEYTEASNSLKTLMESRQIEEETDNPWRPSADSVMLVAGNILGIVAILTFEKANVITSKSMNFVMKSPKI
jgi:hypothetical protein